MWLTHGHTAGTWERQGFSVGKVAKCALDHSDTGLEFNDTVLFCPCLLFWSNIFIFYGDGDKKILFCMLHVNYSSVLINDRPKKDRLNGTHVRQKSEASEAEIFSTQRGAGSWIRQQLWGWYAQTEVWGDESKLAVSSPGAGSCWCQSGSSQGTDGTLSSFTGKSVMKAVFSEVWGGRTQWRAKD